MTQQSVRRMGMVTLALEFPIILIDLLLLVRLLRFLILHLIANQSARPSA